MRERIVIELTEDERLRLEFRLFEYQGLQINFNQLVSGNFDYDNEHYSRIIDTLLEKYSVLQKALYETLSAHGYKNISVKSYDFFLDEGVLTVQT